MPDCSVPSMKASHESHNLVHFQSGGALAGEFVFLFRSSANLLALDPVASLVMSAMLDAFSILATMVDMRTIPWKP